MLRRWTFGTLVLAATALVAVGACKSNAISTGAPPLCAVGQFNCHGDTLQECNAAQNGWDDIATCAPGQCVQGQSMCNGVLDAGADAGPFPCLFDDSKSLFDNSCVLAP
jgi:hypothetical protein